MAPIWTVHDCSRVGSLIGSEQKIDFRFHHIAAKKDGSIIAPKRAFEKTKACEFDVKIIGQHKKTPAGWKVIKMDN